MSEIEDLKARIVALRRFVHHEPGCDITRTDMVNYRKAECTCGLDAALGDGAKEKV